MWNDPNNILYMIKLGMAYTLLNMTLFVMANAMIILGTWQNKE